MLNGSIFGVKLFIPALRGPGGGVVVAPAEKGSHLGSQFDSRQCHELYITPLSCFSQSRFNSLTFWTPVLLCLLLDLDTYGGVDSFRCVSSFSKDGCRYCFGISFWHVTGKCVGSCSVHLFQ